MSALFTLASGIIGYLLLKEAQEINEFYHNVINNSGVKYWRGGYMYSSSYKNGTHKLFCNGEEIASGATPISIVSWTDSIQYCTFNVFGILGLLCSGISATQMLKN